MSGRPEALFALFAALDSLSGIGPKTARHFSGLDVQAPRDLLFTLPQSVIDRQKRSTINGLIFPTVATVAVTVGSHRAGRTKGSAYRVSVEDAERSFQLVFFHAKGGLLGACATRGGTSHCFGQN